MAIIRQTNKYLILFAIALSLVFYITGTSAQESLLDLYSNTQNTPPPSARHSQNESQLYEVYQIEIEVIGVSNNRGVIHVSLFDQEDSFVSMSPQGIVGYIRIEAKKGKVKGSITAVGEPPYAAFVYHDENNDEQLNIRAGRPQEGYGYSGALDPYRPPRFEKAAIVNEIGTVRLTYLPESYR